MKRALVTEPCVSEFGWELMEFQGYVRRQAGDVNVVCSRESRKSLYDDLPGLVFIPHNIVCHSVTHSGNDIKNPEEMERVSKEIKKHVDRLKEEGYKVEKLKHPSAYERKHVGFPENNLQDYIVMGKNKKFFVAHMRNRKDGKDYPDYLWKRVVDILLEYGCVLAVGTEDASICVEGAVDMRGVSLSCLTVLMSKADVVLGPSSGPMHLASLCGTSHVVWFSQKDCKEKFVEARYVEKWNPFGAKANVLKPSGQDIWVMPELIGESVLRMVGCDPKIETRKSTSKLCIVSAYTPIGDWKKMGELTTATKREYADRHNYALRVYTEGFDESRYPAWSKLNFIRETLKEYEWVWWIDSDAAITNHKKTIDKFLDMDVDMVVGRGKNIHTGSFLIRSGDFSFWVLDEMWKDIDRKGRRGWEQDGLNQLYKDGKLGKRIKIFPCRELNGYLDWCPLPHKTRGTESQQWHVGDLVAHCVGGSVNKMSERIGRLRQAIALTVR